MGKKIRTLRLIIEKVRQKLHIKMLWVRRREKTYNVLIWP